jgi:prolyl-tRNA synthetase
VMAAIHGDRKGLVLPMAVAPVQVVIVPIVYKGKGADVIDASRDLARRLEKAGFRVRVDDSDRKPGVKFYYWEMKGVPLRIEIGPRDLESGTVVLVRRDTGKKEKVHNSQAVKAVGKAGKLVLESLGARARENLESHLSEADSMEELAGILTEKGGFVKVPFCSREMEGEACAERIKDETEGEVRGTIFGKEEKPEGMSCIACGKPAGSIVLVARAY